MEKEKPKQGAREVKIDIDNGVSFFADEAGVMHNPLKFILDFRSITPRIDIRNKKFQPLVLRHNVITMDVYTAKYFAKALNDNIKGYEKKYGKINKPDALLAMEKESKKNNKKSKTKKDTPTYLG
ncbi:MAG: DUF3467 domain-containing protein [Nanoarchaeota archaeon]|nr:DUF3467 domain-containing protein [Nanoarchaeota archaeon]